MDVPLFYETIGSLFEPLFMNTFRWEWSQLTKNFPFWLTEEMIKDVTGFNLDAYLLALEGWRRGLTLKWYYDASHLSDLKIIGRDPLGGIFSLSSPQRTHFFQRSRGDRVNNKA